MKGGYRSQFFIQIRYILRATRFVHELPRDILFIDELNIVRFILYILLRKIFDLDSDTIRNLKVVINRTCFLKVCTKYSLS
jgi:hypothetical protein